MKPPCPTYSMQHSLQQGLVRGDGMCVCSALALPGAVDPCAYAVDPWCARRIASKLTWTSSLRAWHSYSQGSHRRRKRADERDSRRGLGTPSPVVLLCAEVHTGNVWTFGSIEQTHTAHGPRGTTPASTSYYVKHACSSRGTWPWAPPRRPCFLAWE